MLAPDADAIAADADAAMPGGAEAVSTAAIGVGGAFVTTEAGGREGSDTGPVGTVELTGNAMAVGDAVTGVSFEQAARAISAARVQPQRTGFMVGSFKAFDATPCGPERCLR